MQPDEIEAYLTSLTGGDVTSRDAWQNYKQIVLELSRGRKVLEVGAGRRPLFSEQEIRDYNIDYHANDAYESELARIDFEVETHVFNMCADVPEALKGQFDFIFSKMVQEHVPDGASFYRNIGLLLKDGGFCLNFHPTLFSLPFVINVILPEATSRRVLRFFFPHRNDDEIPKFPATYAYCYSGPRNVQRVRDRGFSNVRIIPFYHHRYFEKIPLLRQIDDAISALARRRSWRWLSSYAYTVAQK